MDPLLAYAFRSAAQDDLPAFRRLAQLGGELGGVTALCFLLCPARPRKGSEADGPPLSVHDLLFSVMPRLLPQLNRTTYPHKVVMRGRADGRIDWASTYKARYSEEGGSTVFVCRQSRRRYDQPENQLLQFLLHRIRVCLDAVPPSLRGWAAWGSVRDTRGGKPVRAAEELADLAHRLRRFRSSVYLRQVALPDRVGAAHVMAARTAKNPLYGQAADLYLFYTEVVEVTDWGRWRDALNLTAPLPADLDEVSRLLLSTT